MEGALAPDRPERTTFEKVTKESTEININPSSMTSHFLNCRYLRNEGKVQGSCMSPSFAGKTALPVVCVQFLLI